MKNLPLFQQAFQGSSDFTGSSPLASWNCKTAQNVLGHPDYLSAWLWEPRERETGQRQVLPAGTEGRESLAEGPGVWVASCGQQRTLRGCVRTWGEGDGLISEVFGIRAWEKGREASPYLTLGGETMVAPK